VWLADEYAQRLVARRREVERWNVALATLRSRQRALGSVPYAVTREAGVHGNRVGAPVRVRQARVASVARHHEMITVVEDQPWLPHSSDVEVTWSALRRIGHRGACVDCRPGGCSRRSICGMRGEN